MSVRRLLVLAAAVALLFPRDAFAYLDPGTGSMFFQTLVAALAGVAYGVRVYWSRIRRFFSRNSRDGDTSGVPPVDRRDAPPS
jgi:hypothetical protein